MTIERMKSQRGANEARNARVAKVAATVLLIEGLASICAAQGCSDPFTSSGIKTETDSGTGGHGGTSGSGGSSGMAGSGGLAGTGGEAQGGSGGVGGTGGAAGMGGSGGFAGAGGQGGVAGQGGAGGMAGAGGAGGAGPLCAGVYNEFVDHGTFPKNTPTEAGGYYLNYLSYTATTITMNILCASDNSAVASGEVFTENVEKTVNVPADGKKIRVTLHNMNTFQAVCSVTVEPL
ncbi:MAG: hypothetical protein AB1529_02340 [Candidatus Micrarchaeota archaeon]